MMFFDQKDFSSPQLSMQHFREWAGAIANSYLASGTPPTDSLMKIAQTEELTPHQVFVLAGEANKTIHQHKYANASDKYMAADFPLADAKTAISRLQADGGVLKVAVSEKEPEFDSGFDPFKAFGVQPEEQDKTAAVRHELKVATIHAEAVRDRQADKHILSKYAADAAEEKFIKQARQLVLSEDTSEGRMRRLGEIDHFVKNAGMQKAARRPLAKLAYVLKAEGKLLPSHGDRAIGYFKTADQKAPQEFISEWLNAKVVNGQHPLYITLKTYCDASSSRDLHEDRHALVDDRIKIMKQKVRAL